MGGVVGVGEVSLAEYVAHESLAPCPAGRRGMNSYIIVFEWPAAAKIAAHTERFEAACVEDAKMHAALTFGCAPFEHGLPYRYMIFDGRGGLIFRYPEHG